MKELFTLKSIDKVHVIDCEYEQMYRFINMSGKEFWDIMMNDFNADFLKISMPGHHYIMFQNLEDAEKALDWINGQLTALKLIGFDSHINDAEIDENEWNFVWRK